jgi:hypothetical protein
MADKIIVWAKKYKVNVLVVLAVALFAGSMVWLRNYTPYAPEPLSSSANEEQQPHWRHSQVPFTLNLLNHASSNWPKPLKYAANSWETPEMVKFNIVNSKPSPYCEIYPESMNFCSWNDADGWLSQMMYVQGPGDPHIIATVVAVNDAYLMTPKSKYNTDAWRNYILCQSFGWTMGIKYSFESGDSLQSLNSCMNVFTDFAKVQQMQNPDQDDINEMIGLYKHTDDNPSSSISYIVTQANALWKQKDFGTLIDSTENGVQVYEQSLGNGYKMVTALQSASSK